MWLFSQYQTFWTKCGRTNGGGGGGGSDRQSLEARD